MPDWNRRRRRSDEAARRYKPHGRSPRTDPIASTRALDPKTETAAMFGRRSKPARASLQILRSSPFHSRSLSTSPNSKRLPGEWRKRGGRKVGADLQRRGGKHHSRSGNGNETISARRWWPICRSQVQTWLEKPVRRRKGV